MFDTKSNAQFLAHYYPVQIYQLPHSCKLKKKSMFVSVCMCVCASAADMHEGVYRVQ